MKKSLIRIVLFSFLFSSLLLSLVLADNSNSKLIVTSLVNQDPDPAVSGDIVEVRIGVENRGGIVTENLILEIVPQYPFLAVAGEDYAPNLGTLKAYQTEANMKIVKFKVRVDRDTKAGEYELKYKEYEQGQAQLAGTGSVQVEIKSKESAEVIHIDKTTLVPGKETALKFTINNVGSAPLRDLTFSWINADKIILPVGSDNTKYVKYIDVGDSAQMSYQVIADSNVKAGLYELKLSLSYDDPLSSIPKEISTIAGVYVGGGTDFDIAFSESSSGQTSFTIANIGSNPASSVSVVIPQQESWRVSGSNSMIIGNLNTGDYTVTSFALLAGQARMGSQQPNASDSGNRNSGSILTIQIAYTDTMGKREMVEKEVSINQQATMTSTSLAGTDSSTAMTSGFGRRQPVVQPSFLSQYGWYIAGLIILVLISLIYSKYRREKLTNPNYKFSSVFKYKRRSR